MPRCHRAVVRVGIVYTYYMFSKQSTEEINLLYYDPGGVGESRRRFGWLWRREGERFIIFTCIFHEPPAHWGIGKFPDGPKL